MDKTIRAVTACRQYSAASWDAAIATDDMDRGFAADRAACLRAYDRALAELAEDNLASAILSLEEAAWLEKQAGDDSDAKCAIMAIINALV